MQDWSIYTPTDLILFFKKKIVFNDDLIVEIQVIHFLLAVSFRSQCRLDRILKRINHQMCFAVVRQVHVSPGGVPNTSQQVQVEPAKLLLRVFGCNLNSKHKDK